MPQDDTTDAVIVGAGLAGLACGCELAQRGLSCVLLEASDGVGGRARTDQVDGFLLDRGFQVLLTDYPEAKRLLDYPALQLQSFEPGALVRINGKFHRVSDPWRRPSEAMSTLMAPIGSVSDKLDLGKLRAKLSGDSQEDPQAGQISTMQYLRDFGFSSAMIDSFFRPFLGGIFLERELLTSSRMFEFVFRMFSSGEASPSQSRHGRDGAATGCSPASQFRATPAQSIKSHADFRHARVWRDVVREGGCRRHRPGRGS